MKLAFVEVVLQMVAGPVTETPTGDGCVTEIVIELLVAADVEMQVAFEVNIALTTSPLFKLVVLKLAFIPEEIVIPLILQL
ncbi:MAG TPA: hypothetical protein PLJ60_19805 [Chryseolinea sp.]|nr:hypothetical protein [Chryseolinea sp.]